jgi:hypothetical protein
MGTKDRRLLVISLEVANILSNFHHPQGDQILRRSSEYKDLAIPLHNEIRMAVLVNKQLAPLVPGLNYTWLQQSITNIAMNRFGLTYGPRLKKRWFLGE